MQTHLVTAADSKYFNLARQLVESAVAAKFEGNITVLDIGLQEFEADALRGSNQRTAVLPVMASAFDDQIDPALRRRANVSFLDRCRLPSMIPWISPDDNIIWMDADAWFQGPMAPRVFSAVLELGKAFYIPEIDRAYAVNNHHLTISAGWSVGNYVKYFGMETAERLHQLPMINNGVFGAPASHPLWQAWESATLFALGHNDGKPEFGIDQIAFNFAAYGLDFAAYFESLPSEYNWLVTHALPIINSEGELCHPFFPHEPLHVIHLLDDLKWRRVGIRRADLNTKNWTGDSLHLDFDTFKKG